MPEPLAGLAPAKVNLVLEVTGRRADGYHEIDTVLQTLELSDEVTVDWSGRGPRLEAIGVFAAGCPTDETNLAWRAAAALAAQTGFALDGLRIALEKRIPAAGGLGGGASDAATVLRLLQQALPALGEDALAAAAAAVGSDEPFFLEGGTARARGRGERIERLAPLPCHGVVLFVPRFTIERKTARMFEALGKRPFDAGGVAEAFARSAPAAFASADVHNAFERVAFDLFPGLAALWEALEARVQEPVRLAGAGPTLFWIGPASRRDATAEACAGLDCTVIPTRTAGSLWKR